MQIDLQPPMIVDSMVQDARTVSYRRDGNALFVHAHEAAARRRPERRSPSTTTASPWRQKIRRGTAATSGSTTASATAGPPPRTKASARAFGGRTRISCPRSRTASVSRSPFRIPMVDVSNGRLRSTTHNGDGTTTFEWFVVSPINNYSVVGERRHLRALRRQLRRRGRQADDGLLAARVSPRRREGAVQAGQVDDDLLRALVRSVSMVRRRLQARRGAAPRHGAPERRRLRQPLPQRLSRPRSLRHRPRAEVGLHHRPRERARVVGQQRHRQGRAPTCGCTRASRTTRRASTPSARRERRPAPNT